MKVFTKIVLVFFSLGLLAGCSTNVTDNSGQQSGRLMVQAYDSPLPANVEHLYLNISEVSVHRAGANDSGWVTIATPDTIIDFLQLTNGMNTILADTMLSTGHYTQMRLLLTDASTITVGGITNDLFIPSGTQSGVKLNLDFDINADEIVRLYLDFDASQSVRWNAGQQRYIMRPTFRVFKEVESGTISGTVHDTSGAATENARVMAISNSDTTSTLSDTTGSYMLVLKQGTYTLKADAENYSASDTSYSSIQLHAKDELSGYDFVLR